MKDFLCDLNEILFELCEQLIVGTVVLWTALTLVEVLK
jgi:hypothetical protein